MNIRVGSSTTSTPGEHGDEPQQALESDGGRDLAECPRRGTRYRQLPCQEVVAPEAEQQQSDHRREPRPQAYDPRLRREVRHEQQGRHDARDQRDRGVAEQLAHLFGADVARARIVRERQPQQFEQAGWPRLDPRAAALAVGWREGGRGKIGVKQHARTAVALPSQGSVKLLSALDALFRRCRQPLGMRPLTSCS
jgi:hypothetical protein